MSGEKIGSLTNNSRGGWGSRMQTGKYLTRHPHLLLSWDAWGWGRRGWSPWQVGERPGQSRLSGKTAWRGTSPSNQHPQTYHTWQKKDFDRALVKIEG